MQKDSNPEQHHWVLRALEHYVRVPLEGTLLDRCVLHRCKRAYLWQCSAAAKRAA